MATYNGLECSDQLNKLFGDFAMSMRRDAVRSLLAGNDTGCFTTDQYKASYDNVAKREEVFKFNPSARALNWWHDDLAEKHLRSTGLVEEVSPGVWADKTLVGVK